MSTWRVFDPGQTKAAVDHADAGGIAVHITDV
jgi:hypothetical protein